MKKLITLITACIFAGNALAIFEPIPGASYVIFEGGKKPGLFKTPKTATFYTFDGNPIVTVPYPQAYICYLKINRLRLDESTPKRQPATYEIKPISKIFYPGTCAIIFYDKHENVIAKFKCYKNGNTIRFPFQDTSVSDVSITGTIAVRSLEELRALKGFDLDLSRVTEKPKHSKKLK